jgi:anti-sigma B factor antagonist
MTRARAESIFVTDASRGDGKRFVTRADEKLTVFLDLQSAIRDTGGQSARSRDAVPGTSSRSPRITRSEMKAPPSAAAVCVAAIISQHHPNVLPLKGEIDLHVLPAVTESLNIMTDRKVERIVINLSSATYIDSAGLAALILAMQKVKGFGGRFFLAGMDQTMRSIFHTSRLDQIFHIFPDVDAALAAI